ncbi:MAG: hypothetical protein K0S74_657 [Chlamydiales bacterium]|jgi:hypothetical protein|nr:hypothetical protein [Chlamydiales bacterium]
MTINWGSSKICELDINDERLQVEQENLQVTISTIKQALNLIESQMDSKFATYERPPRNYHEFFKYLLKAKEGFNTKQFSASRITIKESITAIVSEVVNTFFKSPQSIVELGSGALDLQGNSWLMQHMPSTIQDHVEPTEANNYFVNLRNTKKQSLRLLDGSEVSKHYSDNSLNGIVSSSFLDTLDEEDLLATLGQSYKTLKERGTFIHFAALEPYIDTFLSAHCTESIIYFPSMINNDFSFTQLQVINRKCYLEYLNQLGQQNIEILGLDFLKEFGNLSPIYLDTVWQMLRTDPRIGRKQREFTTSYLARSMKALNPPGLTIVDNNDFFEKRVHKGLEDTGFNILEFGYREISQFTQRRKDLPKKYEGYNHFYSDHGKFTYKFVAPIAPNLVYQYVKMHIIIAKKPSASKF